MRLRATVAFTSAGVVEFELPDAEAREVLAGVCPLPDAAYRQIELELETTLAGVTEIHDVTEVERMN